MSESIKVGYAPTTLGNGIPVCHKYLLYTNSNGEKYYSRGGSQSQSLVDYYSNFRFGEIVTESGEYLPNLIDYDEDSVP